MTEATVVIPAPSVPAPAAAPAVAPATAPAVAPAPAAPATPDAAPAPLNVDAPAAPPTPAPPAPNEVVEYQPTGDVALDLALGFIGDRGFGPEHPAVKAATSGDFGPLGETLKALGDKAKGYEKYLAAAKESLTRRQSTAAATEQATQQAVVKAVGGVEAWNAIHAFVKENADDAERASINAAFKAGGIAATSMATHLAGLYKASGQSTIKPASAVPGDASRGGASADAPITAQQFKDQMKVLVSKYGFRANARAEGVALNQRRAAGIRAGI